MNISHIVKEEIDRFIEGVGDKYLARKGIRPDEEDEFNKYYDLKHKKDVNKDLGEFGGLIYNQYSDKPESKVFINPKKLDSFDDSVRAITDEEGNLFIGQKDGNYYHRGISKAVNKNTKYYIANPYDALDYITWHRIGSTNDFGYSISYQDFAENDNNNDIVNNMIDAANKKNPQFNFLNKYWEW